MNKQIYTGRSGGDKSYHGTERGEGTERKEGGAALERPPGRSHLNRDLKGGVTSRADFPAIGVFVFFFNWTHFSIWILFLVYDMKEGLVIFFFPFVYNYLNALPSIFRRVVTKLDLMLGSLIHSNVCIVNCCFLDSPFQKVHQFLLILLLYPFWSQNEQPASWKANHVLTITVSTTPPIESSQNRRIICFCWMNVKTHADVFHSHAGLRALHSVK